MPKKGETKITATQLTKVVDNYLKECEAKRIRPLQQEVAYLLGIGKDTLSEYKKIKSLAQPLKKLELASEIHLNRLLEASKSDQNTMFALKTQHGYVEAQYSKIDVTSNGESIGVVMLPERNKA